MIRNLRTLTTLTATLVTAACGGDAGSSPRATAMSLSQLGGVLDQGPSLVEIKLFPGTLNASEVHAEMGEDDEKIESPVSSIDSATGAITLELGGLVVAYGSSTRFRTPEESDVARAEWESAISAGSPIEIRRDIPNTPQAPSDSSFMAEDLRIADETDEPSLELLIGSEHLEVVDASNAILHVLGLEIAVGPSTDLYDDSGSSSGSGSNGSGEFEAAVTSVDVAAGTLTLAGGTVVDVPDSFDPEGDLFTLQAVASAVAASKPVRAEGRGAAGANGVVVATSLKVEVDD